MSAFGQHYKGDVSEVTMGHETGLSLQHGVPATWTAAVTVGNSGTKDYTEITFSNSGTSDTSIFYNSILKVPLGMLIGQRMSFHASPEGLSIGNGNFQDFYYSGNNKTVYSIVDHTLENNATKIKIVPALTNTGSLASSAYDTIVIHSLGMPTLHAPGFIMSSSANASNETSLIDQFVGLASFMTLPDTTVDLHRYHVVGLGRQTAVQQTGKVHHMGGSIELPMHDPRWLYYSLGREVVSAYKCGDKQHGSAPIPKINANVNPGASYIDVASSDATHVKFGSSNAGVGDYLLIVDTTKVPLTTYKTPQLGVVGTTDTYFWPHETGQTNTATSDNQHFEWAESSECRRIVAIESITTLSSGFQTETVGNVTHQYKYIKRIFLDGPLEFTHTTSDTLELRSYHHSFIGSPDMNQNKDIRNPVHRLLFSGDTLPSFCIEHSVRNRDVGSANASSETPTSTVGSETDSQQLTRVFRGCKVVEWEMSSTVDAELKYRCVFDALSCYTDTGRLESTNKGDRYTAHRMFQNTAVGASQNDTAKARKASGIGINSEKPFMFYNGELKAFGESLGLVSAFELRGKTGVELFHTIQGNPVAESRDGTSGISLKQVPYGGTRNASIIREGREEFEMEIDLVLSNANLYHQLRTHVLKGGTVGSTSGYIHLKFTKPIFTSNGVTNYTTPEMNVILDDYYITECPIPMPDDKGLLHTKIKLIPQNLKVTSMDMLYHC